MSGTDSPDLRGLTVGITADRRAEDQAVMFRRMGAEVFFGPTMATVVVPDESSLRKVTDLLIADPPDFFVADTGIGVRAWVAQAEKWGVAPALIEALQRCTITARGPKASGALSSAGLSADWRAPTEQLSEVLDHLEAAGVAGSRVALQLHGDDGAEPIARLEALGATVIPVEVYRWGAPDRAGGAAELVERCCGGSIHAVTFTAAPQVHNLVEVAGSAGMAPELIDALNGGIVVGCIGPVCAAAATEEGISTTVVPENWRLGSLVKVVAAELATRRG